MVKARLGVLGLVRLSLVVVGLSLSSGCSADDPSSVAPQKTAPRLEQSKALPGLDEVIVRSSGELIEFTIPVTSEDAGDPLRAQLLFDYSGDSSVADVLWSGTMAASTLSDPKERVLSIPWIVRPAVAPGCHRFTLRVTHASNVDDDELAELALDKSDQVEAYWFANINVAPEDAGALVDCPSGASK